MSKTFAKTLAGAAVLALSTTLSGAAMAGDPQRCQEIAERDCALFVPVGSSSWANCVEVMPQICIELQAGSTPMTGLERKTCKVM